MVEKLSPLSMTRVTGESSATGRPAQLSMNQHAPRTTIEIDASTAIVRRNISLQFFALSNDRATLQRPRGDIKGAIEERALLQPRKDERSVGSAEPKRI